MGKLRINRVIYSGDKYEYKSPELKKGINVIIGENGCGKSTFTYLIYFALGNEVPFFCKDNKESIEEIVNDTNGKVKLEIYINEKFYTLIRVIDKNEILVQGNGIDEIFAITRKGYLYNELKETFSDWILKELGFGVLEISQFNTTHKINFDDLMSLIYYDQKTPLNKIYKEPFYQNESFFKTSSIMKKNIFEILMGNFNFEYYKVYFKIKEGIKEKHRLEIEIENIEYLIKKINIKKIKNIEIEGLKKLQEEIENKIQEVTSNLKNIIFKLNEGSVVLSRVKALENKLKDILNIKREKTEELNNLLIDMERGTTLYNDYNKDIKDLKKIILTSESFDFYNKETCPFCSEPVIVEKGRCICGSNHGLNYEKFLLTNDEYMKILKSKIKSKEQLEMTLSLCREEMKELMDDLEKAEESYVNTSTELKQILNTTTTNYNEEIVEQLNQEKVILLSNRQNILLLIENVKKIDNLKERLKKVENGISIQRLKLDTLEKEKEDALLENIQVFEKYYKEMIVLMYSNIETISLDGTYRPIINGGVYKEESVSVSKRFFYYISLLLTGLEKNTLFPNFLLIDSIANKGISSKKLKTILIIMDKKLKKYSDYQIILTSGSEEYPEELKDYTVQVLDENNKLLKNKE
ncbi:MAG: AAA family ATPase [Cetobacterium sp.]